MTIALDLPRLYACYAKARDDLLARRASEGHWIGELASSPLATATAVSALSLIGPASAAADRVHCAELVRNGVESLLREQRDDGGWGDTDKSYSNIATTMLGIAACQLADAAEDAASSLEKAHRYVANQGGIGGLRRRYGKDKTFAVPILTNYALAGLVDWHEVAPLPFELACFPQSVYRFLQLPVVSYAIPALVGIGQARFIRRPPRNPLTRIIRKLAVRRSLEVLRRMQPASGGYLEAIPLTCFVAMSLAATGRVDHPVTQQALKFIVASVRSDGSWPIDTNLATWNTTLAMNALAVGGEDLAALGCHDWLLSCQQAERHPFTGAAPGGWGWTDLSGAVPDADDTPGALLALAALAQPCHSPGHVGHAPRDKSPSQLAPHVSHAPRDKCPPSDAVLRQAIERGARWLEQLQNRDGGWPTFCRGWGKLPFDRSGADLTAHVLRSARHWEASPRRSARVARGFSYLAAVQNPDGSWNPLWFGNQDRPDEENPVYGTARVLLAYRDWQNLSDGPAQRGKNWLVRHQNTDGGWGGGPAVAMRLGTVSSVEETALAVEALLAFCADDSHDPRTSRQSNGTTDSEAADRRLTQVVVSKGLDWLCSAVETGRHQENSPIGFYFAKLWYYEKLYPLIFTVSALGQATRQLLPRTEQDTGPAHQPSV